MIAESRSYSSSSAKAAPHPGALQTRACHPQSIPTVRVTGRGTFPAAHSRRHIPGGTFPGQAHSRDQAHPGTRHIPGPGTSRDRHIPGTGTFPGQAHPGHRHIPGQGAHSRDRHIPGQAQTDHPPAIPAEPQNLGVPLKKRRSHRTFGRYRNLSRRDRATAQTLLGSRSCTFTNAEDRHE